MTLPYDKRYSGLTPEQASDPEFLKSLPATKVTMSVTSSTGRKDGLVLGPVLTPEQRDKIVESVVNMNKLKNQTGPGNGQCINWKRSLIPEREALIDALQDENDKLKREVLELKERLRVRAKEAEANADIVRRFRGLLEQD